MLKITDKGFTRAEVIIISAIISLLLVVAVLNFVKARRALKRDICNIKLVQIREAVMNWAFDGGKKLQVTPMTADLVPKYIKIWPSENGVPYTIPGGCYDDPVCPNSATNTDHHI